MNSRAKRLILPLGGALAASSLISATLVTSATATPAAGTTARDDVRTGNLSYSGGDAKAIASHWSKSKLKSAKTYTEDSSQAGRRLSTRANRASADGRAGKIAPTGSRTGSAGRSRNVNLPKTLGKVFFEVDGKPYWCSGSSVDAKFRNLVATAGHCVYDTDKNKYVSNFVFVPGYYQGKAPWGIYVGAKVNLIDDFTIYEDYDHDYAFVNVYDGIKQTADKRVDKKTFDAHTGAKYAKDVAISEAEYRKCVREHGGETPDCWAKTTDIEDLVGPDYPGRVQVKKEVTKAEYDAAPRGARNGAKWEEISGRNDVDLLTKAEYDAYKGPGLKMIDRRGNFLVFHYYLKYFVKKSKKVDYFRTEFYLETFVNIGRLGDNVGGQGFAWNQRTGKKVFVFGYPTGRHPDGDRPYSGQTPKWCYGKTGRAPVVTRYKADSHIAIKCAFTTGGSGGPFMLQYSNARRVGYINGVVSLTVDSDGNDRFDRATTPYFDSDTYGVYRHAANLWTGKLPA